MPKKGNTEGGRGENNEKQKKRKERRKVKKELGEGKWAGRMEMRFLQQVQCVGSLGIEVQSHNAWWFGVLAHQNGAPFGQSRGHAACLDRQKAPAHHEHENTVWKEEVEFCALNTCLPPAKPIFETRYGWRVDPFSSTIL